MFICKLCQSPYFLYIKFKPAFLVSQWTRSRTSNLHPAGYFLLPQPTLSFKDEQSRTTRPSWQDLWVPRPHFSTMMSTEEAEAWSSHPASLPGCGPLFSCVPTRCHTLHFLLLPSLLPTQSHLTLHCAWQDACSVCNSVTPKMLPRHLQCSARMVPLSKMSYLSSPCL
jgi:hypothetical protein